jgi:hypothetical protein
MIFRRKAVQERELITVPAVSTTARSLPDDASLPLVDTAGQGFAMLREMDLGHNLWRTAESSDLDQLPSGQIIVVAAYTPDDIARARPLMGRFMTIILGMGLGPQYGSRALTLGAVGYVDASRDPGDIRGLFSDAVARVRIRRLREAAAA